MESSFSVISTVFCVRHSSCGVSLLHCGRPIILIRRLLRVCEFLTISQIRSEHHNSYLLYYYFMLLGRINLITQLVSDRDNVTFKNRFNC